jgi:prolyl oligopeptidase
MMIFNPAAIALATVAFLGPPPSAPEPVVEDLHGVRVVDEYRWLEPLESESERVREWTTLQNDHTRDLLDDLPGRDRLESRLEELMTLPSISAPTARLNFYFNTERKGIQNQRVLYVREGLDGVPRALVDPNTLDEEGLISLDWYNPNHDGSLVAFGISRAGDENSVLHVLETGSGRWLADEIHGKVRSVDWRPDSSGFFYRDLADLDNPYSARIRYHDLGTHPRHDRTLFEQYKEGPLATTWGPFAYASEDARWMILGYYTSTKSNDLWCVDLDRWFRSGEFVTTEIIVGDDSTNSGPVLGDTLYLQTKSDAPNGRVFAVDLNDPDREGWREVIPEREVAVLRGVSLTRGNLVAAYERNASDILEVFGPDGTSRGQLELPGIGSAGASTRHDRTEIFVTYTSFNDPASIWRLDLATGERSLWARLDVPFDPDSIEVKQVWYTSADGTKVSMFIVHRKGVKRNGDNPTLLSGYGGFNISMTPYFSQTRIPWLEAGGVMAIPNLRGGGEYGERWHADGMLGNKQNVFDDFIAAAEFLIDEGYTSTERLAISGGSNGGLLIGAAVTQRPDLFAGAVCRVPLLDMLRYQDFLMAKYWVPEYGDPEDPQHFRWLHAYSPYHNITEDISYPAILFTAGENDTRVHPMHARKMAARLQQVATNDTSRDPILLWVDRSAGHGAGKPLRLRIRDSADIWSFVMWQTGMLEGR